MLKPPKNIKTENVIKVAVSTIIIVCLVQVSGLYLFLRSQVPQTASRNSSRDTEETSGSPSVVTNEPEKTSFTICFTGDNNLGTYTQDFHKGVYPYKYIEDDMKMCDLLVANLETNLSAPGTGAPEPKGYNFKAPLAALDWMKQVGVDVVSLANNHTMDFGPQALVEQMNLLNENGIEYFGAGNNLAEAFEPKYALFKGTKIAFVGYNDTENHITNVGSNRPGSAYLSYNLVVNAISKAKQNADIVVVFPHWGAENDTRVTQREITWAQYFIDAGADIVVGAGPHVRQSNTTYKGKPIYYSLGMFATCGFYFVPEGSTGKILTVEVENKAIIRTDAIDVKISFLGLPKLPEKTVGLYPSDEFKAGP